MRKKTKYLAIAVALALMSIPLGVSAAEYTIDLTPREEALIQYFLARERRDNPGFTAQDVYEKIVRDHLDGYRTTHKRIQREKACSAPGLPPSVRDALNCK